MMKQDINYNLFDEICLHLSGGELGNFLLNIINYYL